MTTARTPRRRNFGRDAQALHPTATRRADEFVEVVTKLWDSWEDDALIGDKEAGVFADSEPAPRDRP